MNSQCKTIHRVMTCLALLATQAIANGQDTAADDAFFVKVYRVADLVLPTPNYGFKGIRIPGIGSDGRVGGLGLGGGMGGMMGTTDPSGLGGMGGMGMGGGFFSVPNPVDAGGVPQNSPAPRGPASSFRFTLDDLIEAIQSVVEPDRWDDVGGEGSIIALGGMLLIRQTVDVHRKIDDLLDSLRQEGGAVRSVAVYAHWLLLDAEQRQRLMVVTGRGQQINRQVLDELTDSSGIRGVITCFDGQTVHIISGHIKSSVESVIPVVGQREANEVSRGLADAGDPQSHPSSSGGGREDGLRASKQRHYLAQVVSAPTAASDNNSPSRIGVGRQTNVGYQPVTRAASFGALLQVTPTLIPHSQFVVLDLQSTVTRPKDEKNPPVDYRGLIALDRINLVSQQFMTTLRVPLGQPTLVAGSTFEPLSSEQAQMFLVVEAALVGD